MGNKVIWYLLGVVAAVAIWRRRDIEEISTDIMETLSRSQFISKYGSLARSATIGSGLFPSVTLAQAILESGNGNSGLAKQARNFFGIKADSSWTGPYVTMNTTEYVSGKPVTVAAKFRAYANASESFADRVKFLKGMSRYKNAGVFSAATPEAQTAALQKAGYATDPNYATLLNTLITKNNLKQFDV